MQLLIRKNEGIKWLGDMERYVYKTGDFEKEFEFIVQSLLHL